MLLEIYQRLRELSETTPEGSAGDYVSEQLDEACNCILRAAHEADPKVYLECVAWEANRVLPPSVTSVESVTTIDEAKP